MEGYVVGADLEGNEDVLAMLENLREAGPRMMDLWGTDFLTIVDEEVPTDTHNLQWSIPANTQRGDWQWIVGTNVEYAPYVHEGVDPFFLDSPVNIKGNWVYIKTHPGIQANPFFDRTLDQTESKLEDYLTEAMGDIG